MYVFFLIAHNWHSHDDVGPTSTGNGVASNGGGVASSGACLPHSCLIGVFLSFIRPVYVRACDADAPPSLSMETSCPPPPHMAV